MNSHFDPGMLYAECRRCGSPVLHPVAPDEEILWMGIAPDMLNAECLLLYDSCPRCSPGEIPGTPRFIRLGNERRLQAH